MAFSVIDDVRMDKSDWKHYVVWISSVLIVSKTEKACAAQMCIGTMEISAHEEFALWQIVRAAIRRPLGLWRLCQQDRSCLGFCACGKCFAFGS